MRSLWKTERQTRKSSDSNCQTGSGEWFLVVLGMAGAGMAMMMGGLLAWVVGESALLVTGVVAGAIFVSAGGLGVLRCLDGK